MTLYIGVDIHARQQTLSYLDTEDGTTDQVVLDHEVDDIAGFYRKFQGEVIIGIEACGYTNWFEELVERLGHKLLAVSYTHLRAHETPEHLVCRLLLEKKKKKKKK